MRFEVWIRGPGYDKPVECFNRPWNNETTPPYSRAQREQIEDQARWALALWPDAREARVYRRAPDLRHIVTLQRTGDENDDRNAAAEAATYARSGRHG